MKQHQLGSIEYFRQEILRFRGMMSDKKSMSNMELMFRAWGGLATAYFKTEVSEEAGDLMSATKLEFERRMKYHTDSLFLKLGK